MFKHTFVISLCCSLALLVSGCSRQQSDWQKTRETNTADAYEQFLKKYPSGEFTAQAQARVKELYEERDWQKARDADTPDAYQSFLKQYPEGKWTEEARIRVENFTLAQAPSGSGAVGPGAAEQGAAAATAAAAAAAAAAHSEGAASPAASAKTAPAQAASLKAVPRPQVAATRAAAHGGASPSPHAAASTTAAGPYAVQLGAFKSGEGAAQHRWTHLQHEYPKLLAGLSSKVLPKKTTGGSVYRLQAIGLTEKHAHDVCSALKAKSQPCIVVAPTPG